MDFSKLDFNCLDIPGWSGPVREESHEETGSSTRNARGESRDDSRNATDSRRSAPRDSRNG